MDDILWVEKYRPQTIEECILPSELKQTFQQFVDNEEIPNLLLTGTAGVGKTTIAKAMLEQIGCTYMMINGSEESGIDMLRTKIKNFASTVSMDGKRKYVILDEADYLNPQSTQPALRGFIEEFSRNCGFILTCNFRNRIIEPLHSRCSTVEFRIPNAEKPQLAMGFMKRVQHILETENVKSDERVVAELINKFFPDWRRCLNELQRYSATGNIDAGILVNLSDTSIKELVSFIKDKDFKSCREWVVHNLDNDPHRIYRRVYDSLSGNVPDSAIPHCVLILGNYSYKSAFVADQEINLLACLTEMMIEVPFK
jgi:DNA polymerase III delta prime subunit|tara:strand:+ start:408 stop:1343 length:936 start_codon:yes stop_codon:yes gene_type:complete